MNDQESSSTCNRKNSQNFKYLINADNHENNIESSV